MKINVGDVFDKIKDKRNKRIEEIDSRRRTQESGTTYKTTKKTITLDSSNLQELGDI